MPAYSFKKQFVPLVREGSKRHTIRAERKQAQRVGDPCYLYYAMRTKQCEFLLAAPCTRVERIAIPTIDVIYVNRQLLSADEAERFAWADGFRPELEAEAHLRRMSALDLMMNFWIEEHGPQFEFVGHLIHWDYDRRITDRTAAKHLVIDTKAVLRG